MGSLKKTTQTIGGTANASIDIHDICLPSVPASNSVETEYIHLIMSGCHDAKIKTHPERDGPIARPNAPPIRLIALPVAKSSGYSSNVFIVKMSHILFISDSTQGGLTARQKQQSISEWKTR